MSKPNQQERIVASAVKTEAAAPLVGAPAEYLGGPAREADHTLLYPFKLAGVEYRVLTVRKLTGKEIFAMNKVVRDQGISPEAALFSAMCRIPLAAVEAIDAEDLGALSTLSANFTPQLASTSEEPTGPNGENMSGT